MGDPIDLWIETPDSEAIAARLNASGAEVCEHDRDPCFLRCGVRGTVNGWKPIPQPERLEWFADIRARVLIARATRSQNR